MDNREQANKPRRGASFLLLGLLIILGAVLVVYLWNKNGNLDKTYHYSVPVSYNLSDPQHNDGISLIKPSEFELQYPPALPQNAKILLKPVEARFVQSIKVDGSPVIIAQLALGSIATVPASPRLSPPSLSSLAAPAQNYINSLINPNYPKSIIYKISFDQPKPLVTPNINNDAWYIGFTAQRSRKVSKKTTPDLQGLVVEATGKNGQYHAALYTVKVNWQNNQALWHKMINSLKIDQ